MKKIVQYLFASLMLVLCFALPVVAQTTDVVTTGDPDWMGTVSMVCNAVLLVVSMILGKKWVTAKGVITSSADKLADPMNNLSALFHEINIFISDSSKILDDDKVTKEELKKATEQLKLIIVKLKLVLSVFKKQGITPA